MVIEQTERPTGGTGIPVVLFGALRSDDDGESKGKGKASADPLAVALLARFDAAVVDQTVERAAILEHDAGMPRDAAEAAVCDLYVATDLSTWLAPVLPDLGRTGYADRVRSDGRDYRRLDREAYASLYALMAKAKALAERGTLPDADWQRLRERFAVVHRFAVLKGVA